MKNYEYLDLLDKIGKKLDPKQRAVCCRTDNTIVAAGAGSGKTQVLATRFAWLVMSCNIPASQILTLTFTKKAAGEMYKRIYDTLSFFAAQPETPAQEKQRALSALEDFSNVHIQTLDSYCKNIVEQGATRYGITPDFSVGSGDSESDIKKLALPFVFENRNEEAVKQFASVGNYQHFADSVLAATIIGCGSISSPENYFTEKLAAQKREVIGAWNFLVCGRDVQPECPELLKDSYDSFIEEFSFAGSLRHAAAAVRVEAEKPEFVKKAGTPYFEKVMAALALEENIDFSNSSFSSDFDFESLSASDLEKIEKIRKFVQSFDFPQNLAGHNKEIRGAVKPLKEFYITYISALAAYILNFSAIKNLNQLFDKFLAKINENKRTSGNLTFKDVTELALKILIEHKDIRQQEKNSYSKIMIDEFQDNNGKNRDLLFLLSEKDFAEADYGCKDGIPAVADIKNDKLFFVGDEKQSIYKFRGAEVSVFNQLKTDLGTENFLQMEYNYRSSNELITSFNKLFGKNNYVFNSLTEKNYEAKYEKFAVKFNPKEQQELPESSLSLSNAAIHSCLVNTKLLENDDTLLDQKNLQAYFVAKKIARMMQEAKQKGEKLNFSDFAILDKSRKRTQLLRWLNHFEIPYQLDQNSDLFADGPVNDIYNYLRLCVYPSDMNAFAVFLASPFCGLNPQSVEAVLLSANASELPSTEIELINAAEEILCENSQTQKERFVFGMLELKKQQQEVLRRPIAQTISYLWNKLGYQYSTLENLQTELFAQQFDFLFELARQNDIAEKNVSWFVDQLAIVKNKESSSLDDEEIDVGNVSYPIEVSDSVQIMTIHKSKGLQFNYVFIMGCIGAKNKSDTSTIFFDEEFGTSVNPESGAGNYFNNVQKLLAKQKDLAEFRRLIYVAITRAIREVYITGSWKPEEKKNSSDADDKTSLKLLENTIKYFYPEVCADNEYALGTEVFSNIEDAPFSFMTIEPVSKAKAYDKGKSEAEEENSESIQSKNQLYEKLIETAGDIEFEQPVSIRKTPSSLETEYDAQTDDEQPDDFETENLDQKYDNPDDLLQDEGFTAADFGTLVHDYLRAQAEGISPQLYNADVKLFKNLNEKEIAGCKKVCAEMCRMFEESESGLAAYSSDESAKSKGRFIKAEWAFRMFYEDSIWTGSIDLIYEKADGTYAIVDYKTDHKIVPEKYAGQQRIYKIAAARLLKILEEKISCSLYYLRYNKEVPLE